MSSHAHTMDHAELIAKKYKDADLRYQIFNSKDVLQKKLGIKIRDFCYPYGKYNDEIIKLVKEAGYDTARDQEKRDVHQSGRLERALQMQNDGR